MAETDEAEGEWLLARWKLEPGRNGGVGGKQTGTLAMVEVVSKARDWGRESGELILWRSVIVLLVISENPMHVILRGEVNILAGCMVALSAPSKRVEIEGSEHLGWWSSTGGERGGCERE